jgi:hypothetical protein
LKANVLLIVDCVFACHSLLQRFQAPLRESATDLICLALDAHPKSVSIAQSGCRALANLATTLYTVVSNTFDNGLYFCHDSNLFLFSNVEAREDCIIYAIWRFGDLYSAYPSPSGQL